MSDLLFDVDRNPTKLELAKRNHGLESYDCGAHFQDDRWMVISRPHVVEALGGYGVTNETPFFDLFGRFCRLMDEAHLIGYGATEVDAVLDVCKKNNIAVIL